MDREQLRYMTRHHCSGIECVLQDGHPVMPLWCVRGWGRIEVCLAVGIKNSILTVTILYQHQKI